jgi:jumonji domain-containing protein 2
MTSTERVVCPLLHPTKEEFARPFVDFVEKVFKEHPDWPCFRVVPPKGYTPRKGSLPPTRSVQINTPIRQHVGHILCFYCLS